MIDDSDRQRPPRVTVQSTEVVGVVLLAAFARFAYYLLGVRFNAQPLGWFWQFADPELLREDLLRTVWSLHAQPPLMNLGTGLVLQLPNQAQIWVFQSLFLACGGCLALALLHLQARLHVRRLVRLLSTVIFVTSPPVILYENHLFYTYPTATMLTLSALFLHRFAENDRLIDAFAFVGLLAGVVLTRSLFHPLFLVAAVALVAVTCRNPRRVFLPALPWVLLVAIWSTRGVVLFGSVASSSWLGMSLAQMVGRIVPMQELHALAGGQAATAILQIPAFSYLNAYRHEVPASPPTGVPVLDLATKRNGLPNFHHYDYIEISRRYFRAVLRLVIREPSLYFKAVAAANLLFLRSPTDSEWLEPNLSRLEPVDRWYRVIVFGQLHRFRGRLEPSSVAWVFLLAGVLILILSVRRVFATVRNGAAPDPETVTVVFMLGVFAWVYVVGNVLELGENNRFQFLVDPLLVVLAGLVTGAPKRQRPIQACTTQVSRA